MSKFRSVERDPSQLKARRRAFRTHPESQIERLCASIQAFGFNQVVAIDKDDRIVCGAALVEAARRLSLSTIPTVCLDHLDEAGLRAYAIAANKLADLAGYDEAELALEIGDILGLLGDIKLPELGIETPELDRLLKFDTPSLLEPEEPVVASAVPVASSADMWAMGARHRLSVSDAILKASYPALMAEELAQAIISDLPYNRPTKDFSTTGRFDDFVQGAGEMNSNEFVRFMSSAMRNMCEHSCNGSLHYLFMSHHFLLELLRAGRIAYNELKTIITWVKPSIGLGSLYRSRSEFIAVFKHGTAPHRLHANRRNRSTVWEYDSLSTFQAGRDELLSGHPTPKGIDLIRDAVLDASDPDGIVLDPFAGSGTLALACEDTGRRARMIEIAPQYADVALRRFRSATGIEPILERTGQTFSELEQMAEERAGEQAAGHD